MLDAYREGFFVLPDEMRSGILSKCDLISLIRLHLCSKAYNQYIKNFGDFDSARVSFISNCKYINQSPNYNPSISELNFQSQIIEKYMCVPRYTIVRSKIKYDFGLLFQVIEVGYEDSYLPCSVDYSIFLKVGFDGKITCHKSQNSTEIDFDNALPLSIESYIKKSSDPRLARLFEPKPCYVHCSIL